MYTRLIQGFRDKNPACGQAAGSGQANEEETTMAGNRGVAYMGPGVVEVQGIDIPKLALGNRKCEHGVIL